MKIKIYRIANYTSETEEFIANLTERYGPNPKDWDWYDISLHEKLSEDLIREFKDKVNWSYISAYQKISEDFIKEFKDKVNWFYISSYQKLSEDFIKEFKDKVNWYYISYYQRLSEDFIEKFKDYIDMKTFVNFNPNCPPEIRIKYMKEHNLIKKQDPKTHDFEYHEEVEKPKNNSLEELKQLISINLNEKITIAKARDNYTQDLIDRYTKIYGPNPKGWYWTGISNYDNLSENFIREFKDEVYWLGISHNQTLSEDFIREFKDRVNWPNISGRQRLSEDFIREFKNNVDWYWISYSQKLSEDFINEFKDKINMGVLYKRNANCPPGIKIKYMKERNIIKKQDPETHDFEYEEPESSKPKNNSLEELKQLISINLNEKITIAKIDDIISQSNSPSKPDKNKINKALSSFWNNFDENDIPKTNKQLSDLIEVAMFNPIERRQFLGKIKKELSSKGISLDNLDPMN